MSARGVYPPGIDADTIRIAALRPAAVAAGGSHSCALTSVGDLYCWGDDSSGQLGDGSAAHVPGRPVLALRQAVQVDAGGAHTCAVDVRGAVHCWGDGSDGQLGDGGRTDRVSAVAVTGLAGRDVVEVATGARHSCALDDEGGTWCWGDGSPAPRRVGLTEPVVDIAAGGDRTCAVLAGGTVSCWKPGADRPAVVAGLPRAREVTVGATRACVLDVLGQAACWGGPGLGAGPLERISAGGEQVCGVERGGRARCGDDGYAALGTLIALDAGEHHACAYGLDGVVSCWTAGAVPVPVPGLPRPPGGATAVQARALDGGLRLSWQPPADLGSGPFAYFWATTAGYEAGCTRTEVTATGCELTGLVNDREYDVAVVVRTADGITVSDLVTAAPAAGAPLPSEARGPALRVLPGGSDLPVGGLSPLALFALGTLLLGGGLAARLVRRS